MLYPLLDAFSSREPGPLRSKTLVGLDD